MTEGRERERRKTTIDRSIDHQYRRKLLDEGRAMFLLGLDQTDFSCSNAFEE